MDRKINLINKFRTYKFPVEVLYNTEENDKYNFTVKMKCEKGKEYAVLFVNKDESFYTAEIFGSDISEKTFTVLKLKIANCEKIRIVDIETEQAVFEADFKIRSNEGDGINSATDKKVAAEDEQEPEGSIIGDDIIEDEGRNIAAVENEAETDKENGNCQAIELPGPVGNDIPEDVKTQPAVKIKTIITEERADTDIETADDSEKPLLEEDDDYYADYEKDASQSFAISDNEQDPYDIDLFIQDTVKPEVKKSLKAALINDNEGILEEVFEKFDLFESPLKNHVFYKLDETNAKKSALKIILNGFIVPVLSPLLEYKNPFGTSGSYPKYLIGETIIDGETEYYVYGALGRNLREEQPFSGATGFVYFEKMKDSEEGYWLMYVNAKTGRISLPMRPKNI